MNQLINQSNAKKVISFMKNEVKSHFYTRKIRAEFNRMVQSNNRKHKQNLITETEYEKQVQKIEQWFKEKSANPLYNSFVFVGVDITTIHILYNQLRRGNKRPHTGSVEKDQKWLDDNKYSVNFIQTYISKNFPMTNEIKIDSNIDETLSSEVNA